MENKTSKRNKTIRVENINVKPEVYEELLRLKAETGIPMKSLIGLILNISVKDIEIQYIKQKKEVKSNG